MKEILAFSGVEASLLDGPGFISVFRSIEIWSMFDEFIEKYRKLMD
jgi:hypothetical protein